MFTLDKVKKKVLEMVIYEPQRTNHGKCRYFTDDERNEETPQPNCIVANLVVKLGLDPVPLAEYEQYAISGDADGDDLGASVVLDNVYEDMFDYKAIAWLKDLQLAADSFGTGDRSWIEAYEMACNIDLSEPPD